MKMSRQDGMFKDDAGGNILYDASRMAAYNTIAKLASEERREKQKA